MSTKNIGLVSVGVVALNEAAALSALLEDIVNQDYPHENIEVVLIDSGSSDGTRDIMESFAEKRQELGFSSIEVLDNPKRIQAAGWNVFFRNAKGDVFIRVDGHAAIARDFVSRNVAVLNAGEDVCGGYRPTIVDKGTQSNWAKTLHIAEEAAFGSSVSDYRRGGEARYVDSLFHGAYRREVIEKVGLFDERLLRTEDNDLHYRIREAGYKIRFDPSIRSAQFARSSLKKMLKQKYGNGYWIGRTLFVQPKCLQKFHFAPFIFVLGIIALASIGAFATWLPFAVCAALYAAATVVLTIRAAIQSSERNWTMVALPFVFFGIHVSYGVGTLVGLIAGAFKKMPVFDTTFSAEEGE